MSYRKRVGIRRLMDRPDLHHVLESVHREAWGQPQHEVGIGVGVSNLVEDPGLIVQGRIA